MNKTLGLDLGSNSLGWAVLNDLTGDILNKGVVVFPEGIDAANDTLDTPAAIRREKRMGRRMKFRRKMRKWALLKILIDNKMCPMTSMELEAWKKTGKYPIENEAFIKWLKSTDITNPYMDRANAANGPVDKFVLGRALYHICQRRGFKSSRKDMTNGMDDERSAKRKKDDMRSVVKGSIAQLDAEVEAAGCKTLGQYFAKIIDDEKNTSVRTRIRNRHTGRIEHYEKEFAEIMKTQGIVFVPRKSREDEPCLYEKLHTAIFYQRPLRSQKHLVGHCPLEPKSARCRISHPAYEEFRMLSFVNNLSFEKLDADGEGSGEKLPLTAEDRAEVCKIFYKSSATIKFGDIARVFKKRFKDEGLRFYYYRDSETVASCQMRHRIARAFDEIKYDEQKVFDALCFYNDDDKLAVWFKKHYPSLDEKQVTSLVRISPKEGHAKYSLKAIHRILPFLRRGLQLFDALMLAKLNDLGLDGDAVESIRIAFGELKAKRTALLESKRQGRILKKENIPTLLEMCTEYLRDNIFGDNVRKLDAFCRYYRGNAVYTPETWYWKNKGKKEKVELNKNDDGSYNNNKRLPDVNLGMIRNPLVQRSMTVLRRLVNYLAEHNENGQRVNMGLGIIDESDTIRIELARGVNDYATRHAIQIWQNKRAIDREKAHREIEKLGLSATEDAIDRYILWEEQGHMCLYTGEIIKQKDIFTGEYYDIEHTIPRSRSGDDSLANKTVCNLLYNRNIKKGAIPTECPNWDRPCGEWLPISQSPVLKKWKSNLETSEKNYSKQLNMVKQSSDPEKKSKARIAALVTRYERDYWREKLRRFTITSDKLTDPKEGLNGFKKRQLVDTGIMCSHAVEFLRSVYPRTYAVNGTATAFARKAWGVQTDAVKDRSNHTHHAKDAMVIAALTPARFNAICTALKDDGSMAGRRECDICPVPYENFAENIRKACDEILVRHIIKQSSKKNCLAKSHASKKESGRIVSEVLSRGDTIRGQLHNDTVYGCIINPESGEKVFVVRKSLVGPITGQYGCEKWIAKIVDPVVKDIVRNAVDCLLEKGEKNIEPGMIKMPSGVPINKVRVFDRTTDPYILRKHAFLSKKEYKENVYVSASPNFRLAIFNRKGKLSFETESMLSWSQEHIKGDYCSLSDKDGFLGFIAPKYMAIAHNGGGVDEVRGLTAIELSKRLYYVRVFPSRVDNHAEIQFHKEARAKKDITDKDSIIDPQSPRGLIRTSAGRFLNNLIFEGIHFKMMLDGSIKFL